MFFAVKSALFALVFAAASTQALRLPKSASISLATRNARLHVARQVPGETTDFPAECQNDCVGTLADPTTPNCKGDDLTCICTDEVIDDAATCFQCLLGLFPLGSPERATSLADANSALTEVENACAANGLPVQGIELIDDEVPPPPAEQEEPHPPVEQHDTPPPPAEHPPVEHPPKHEESPAPHPDECVVRQKDLTDGKFVLIRM